MRSSSSPRTPTRPLPCSHAAAQRYLCSTSPSPPHSQRAQIIIEELLVEEEGDSTLDARRSGALHLHLQWRSSSTCLNLLIRAPPRHRSRHLDDAPASTRRLETTEAKMLGGERLCGETRGSIEHGIFACFCSRCWRRYSTPTLHIF
jgi:hypothetical protein